MHPSPVGAATPIVFDAAGSWCFGWLHRAAGPARRAGVVLCRPLGYEALCSYQTYGALAETLARSGFDVLRFDYQGTGDSAGSDAEPDRVAAWVTSIVAATKELRRVADVDAVSLFGVRVGATLAVDAALELGGVDSLVLWAPCTTGRAFVRELRAASSGSAQPPAGSQAGDLEALGFLYTAQTLHDLHALDGLRIEKPPAPRALVVLRDDIPGEGPLPAAWREKGVEVSALALPGYARMMVEPHKGVVEQRSLDAIAQWLLAASLPEPRAVAPRASIGFTPRTLPGGIQEIPLRFGPAESLFGVLAQPPDDGPLARRKTAILFLNVGHNYRIGPNRLYVQMARALAACGYRALRFDLSGIGDSPGTSGPRQGNYYAKGSEVDVSAAIDRLEAEGCTKFWLMGVCSGSFVAFQAAQADPRVSGQVLMNSRLLEWQDGADENMWQASMQRNYKSTAFYRRELMRPQVYRRLLRGEVDVNGIARRVGTVIEARLKRAMGRLLHRGPDEEGDDSVLSQARRITARGVDTLLVVAADDDGRDYIEYHFGQRGSRMAGDPNFRMIVVEGCDHTFSSRAGQHVLIETVRRHLEQKSVP
jgi:pimeloyl-ACP methyl ester carboxylesterase